MKMYGVKFADGRQELISVVLDEDGNPRMDTLRPHPVPEDWQDPVLLPVVKQPAPAFDATTQEAVPKVVWFDDRVERQWDVLPLPQSVINAKARAATRSALAAQWAALPAWLRGPFDASYKAANALVDAGDDVAAVALIQYAQAPSGYDSEQLATFEQVKADMVAGISSLPPA